LESRFPLNGADTFIMCAGLHLGCIAIIFLQMSPPLSAAASQPGAQKPVRRRYAAQARASLPRDFWYKYRDGTSSASPRPHGDALDLLISKDEQAMNKRPLPLSAVRRPLPVARPHPLRTHQVQTRQSWPG